jgi:GDP-4-dehydro-6-deoxy-D-mannose reductase
MADRDDSSTGVPLVTGGSGFAGSHLIERLLEHEPVVAAWSNRSGQPVQSAEARIRWRAVDLLNRADVSAALAVLRPSAIYHCAGVADVGGSWAHPERALAVNALGTHHLFEGLRSAELRCRVLVTGSALVYRQSSNPIHEESAIGPATPYGVSKLAQEIRALQETACPVIMTRPFNHAGPRQVDAYVTSAFAKQIAQIEAGLSEPVLRVGNLDSQRDISDVRDVVRAYALLMDRGAPGRPYNVCSGRAYRIGDLLETLIGLSTVAVRIERDPVRMRPSDNPIIVGDRSRIRDDVGWVPAIPIEQTLADLLAYWRQRTRASLS